jgi:hypothetical protein
MSYIDTFDHSVVGDFLYLPVYHPLFDTSTDEYAEFKTNPKNLVIGGGSGEHPGMVIKNLDACVWEFLEITAKLSKKEIEDTKLHQDWFKDMSFDDLEKYNPYLNLEYTGWDLDRITNFTKKVNEGFSEAVGNYLHTDDLRKLSAEEKINIMIGEFVFYSGRKLLSPELQDYLNNVDVKKELHAADIYLNPIFHAVIVPPKGYPVYGRYLQIDNMGETKLIHGLRFDEEDEKLAPASTVKRKIR